MRQRWNSYRALRPANCSAVFGRSIRPNDHQSAVLFVIARELCAPGRPDLLRGTDGRRACVPHDGSQAMTTDCSLPIFIPDRALTRSGAPQGGTESLMKRN